VLVCVGWEAGDRRTYLGEKVVKEKEYLSAMITVYTETLPAVTSMINRGMG
jgi:hypothetical protein